MFGDPKKGCASLKTLDLSSFNTEKVTNMSGMFQYCTGLESVKLKSFNTWNVNDMKFMFLGCSSLKSLDLSSFKVPKADVSGMFLRCGQLTRCSVSDVQIANQFGNSENR